MNFIIGEIIGLLIGTFIGITIMALFNSSNDKREK